MKLTILFPIIRFNEFSRKAMKHLGELPYYPNLLFYFVVSNEDVKQELETLISGIRNQYEIAVADSKSSNKLRSFATKVKTDYFYFHDCDDVADYEFLNDYISTLTDTSTVHCFNVDRIEVVDGEEKQISPIYNDFKEGEIQRLENLPVTVYSKFIPTKFATKIDFPNLPFTQDWAISYSLFLAAPHRFNRRSTYTYYIYGDSSSRSKYDTIPRLNRISSYSKDIINKYKSRRLKKEADFIGFRYNTTLAPRYARLGVIIKPYILSLTTFANVNTRAKMAFVYQTMLRLGEAVKVKILRKY